MSGRRERYALMSCSQDVCVPAVLGELAPHVQVYPAQRERAAAAAVDDAVQPQG